MKIRKSSPVIAVLNDRGIDFCNECRSLINRITITDLFSSIAFNWSNGELFIVIKYAIY